MLDKQAEPQKVGTPALSRGAAWALTLTATFTMAVSYMDRQTLAALSVTVSKELAISEFAFGWLVSSFSIAYLVGSPFAGRLIDRVGARRGLLGAVLVWSAVAALHAPVPTLGVLFVLRIALGLAESPSFPGAAQTVHRALPPADRSRGFGVLFIGSSIGAMIAPKLATFLEAQWGWRYAFLGTAAVGLCWVPMWLAIAYRPAARKALDQGTSADTEAPRLPAVAAAPANASGWQVARELLKHVAVLRGMAVIVAMSPIVNFVLNWGPKYLARDYGATQTEVGNLLPWPPIFFDVGAIGFGHLASVRARAKGYDGTPPRLLLAIAALLLVGAGAAMPFATSPGEMIVFAGISLAGSGGLSAVNTADMLGRVSPTRVSTAGGIAAAAQSLAYIIVNPLVGWLVDHRVSYPAIIVGLAIWAIPGCLVWLLWRPPPLADKIVPAPETDARVPQST